MTKAAWFSAIRLWRRRIAAAVLLMVVAVIMGCRQPLQPIEVNVLPPDDGVDTVSVAQLLGFWKNKDDYPIEVWKQLEFRENGQYTFSVWDSTARGQFTAGKQVYAELGVWQLTPPNMVYMTVLNATERRSVDTNGYFTIIMATDYMWVGRTLYQRGKW